MDDDNGRRTAMETRLAEVRSHLATLPRGSVAYRDALSAVRHLERVIFGGDDLPPTVNPYGLRRRP